MKYSRNLVDMLGFSPVFHSFICRIFACFMHEEILIKINKCTEPQVHPSLTKRKVRYNLKYIEAIIGRMTVHTTINEA